MIYLKVLLAVFSLLSFELPTFVDSFHNSTLEENCVSYTSAYVFRNSEK